MENTRNNFFTMPEDETLLSDVESRFFLEAIKDDEEYLLSKTIIDIMTIYPEDRARQLYEIAEFFKDNIVEVFKPQIDRMQHSTYINILNEAIYNVDSFKIAEELLRQFEDKRRKKVA
jgi:hypothetical protein